MNIPIEKLSNGTIIQIAQELECDISYPEMPKNKYFNEIWNKLEEGIDNIPDEFKKKYEEEQVRVEKEINILFDKYVDDLVEWLYNKYSS